MVRLLLSTLMLIFLGSMASAHGSYKIRTGDVLVIEVLEDESLDRVALVLPDGTITVPLVGSIAVRGRTLAAVQAEIISGLSPSFATAPNVLVSVDSLNVPTPDLTDGFGRAAIDVFVMGAVNVPGKTRITAGTNLLQFLAQSGGFTPFAAKKRIQLRRTDSKTGKTVLLKFNFDAIKDGSASAILVPLQNNDVIIVPERRLFE